jgi:hypothetical protein
VDYKLNEVFEYLTGLGYNVVFVSLYGSQNYNMTTPQSDLDYKAVVLPTLEQLVRNHKPISKSVEYGGGLIDLKDIRLFTEILIKCNPAYLETLYTTKCTCRPSFLPYYSKARENLPQHNAKAFGKACLGMMLEKQHAMTHPYPIQADEIAEIGYAKKQLHHLVRIGQMLRDFAETNKMILVPKSSIRQDILRLKTDRLDNLVAMEIAKNEIAWAKEIVNNIADTVNYSFADEIKNIQYDLMLNELRKEL